MATDEATVTTWWIRRGDILTWVNIVHDPTYLAEPLIRSSEYRLTLNSLVPPHPCTAAYEGLEKGHVPHFLPGENPFLKDIRARYGVPADGPTGGLETMYPEVRTEASQQRLDERRRGEHSLIVTMRTACQRR